MHGTEGHIAVYGPACRPQNSILTGPKCHEVFAIVYSILANLLDDMFFVIVYLRQKKQFGQNPEENIIFIGPGQYIANSSWH